MPDAASKKRKAAVEEAAEVAAAPAADGPAAVNGVKDEPVAEAGAAAEMPVYTYEPVNLGPKVFNKPEDMYTYFSWLLGAATLDQELNEYEFMVMRDLLEKGHERAKEKVGCGIKAIFAGMHPDYDSRCFLLLRTDGTKEDFSYRKCVGQLMPTPDGTVAFPKRALGGTRGGRGGRSRGTGFSGGRGGRGSDRGGGGGGRAGGRGGGRGRGAPGKRGRAK